MVDDTVPWSNRTRSDVSFWIIKIGRGSRGSFHLESLMMSGFKKHSYWKREFQEGSLNE
ncbi:hypothetical protein ZOSMA_4G00410 [Zostera marina]|uniref:Uncharacterized protein n=1 Tax=Zostera marina TaxID=29655 RepID=A0A0K9NY83_ZOSMR|nr:hypothetical protein ZOSMA_4G00410 [Zostera marina]